MNFYWLLFINLAVVGGLIYNVSFKLAPPAISPFVFCAIVGLTTCVGQSLCIFVAKYGLKIDILNGVNPHSITLAVYAGLGAALVDVGFFLALRYGSVVSSQAFWTIGGVIALTIFSILVFKEAITPIKACGIVLGIVSLLLLTRQPG